MDVRQTVSIRGSVHRLAQPEFDRGAVDPAFPMNHMVLFVKPSTAQQTELDRLLADQQNPSSKQFRRWLSPEEFGNRFGLTPQDHSRVVAWLHSQGFTVEQSARARNWIMFSGTAAQVRQALHTEIHRFEVNGESHFANIGDPAVPAALDGLVGGFEGLHDFQPKPSPKRVTPDYNIGATHYLVPADYATIYDINPLYGAGIDGTGVNIGIIGTTSLMTGDIQTFRSNYGLSSSSPKQVLAGSNPGLSLGALEEADLDIEWAGAVAPGAVIYYYYSTSLTTAIGAAVNANLVHMISISYGGAELDNSALVYRPIFQQANAQGITVFASTGDSGAASYPDSASFSRFGPAVQWPASYPEVTAVGGTQFNEGTGTYWSTKNNPPDSSSALSYIPEMAWSGSNGGASAIFSKPAWQSAPGVPQDQARDVPDISMAASCHDGFIIVYDGSTVNGICGTSASAPSIAGVIALLNHYLVGAGQLATPGLGNINPQLYRLAQAAPTAYHDITQGGNTVSCTQGSPGCSSGTFGYLAVPGYDLATGIGSLDVNQFVTGWSTATNDVGVTLSVSPAKGTLNDTFQLTATVLAESGAGTPTGEVDFSNGSLALGSAQLAADSGQPTASFSLPGYLLGATGTFNLVAQYQGDASFSSGGATAKLQITAPTGVASIVPSVPVSVVATVDPTGLFWEFTMSLREMGGVAAVLTGVNVDGQDQPVADYFPTPSIPPYSTLTSRSIIYRGLAYPLVRTFIFSGVDATGQPWSRQSTIAFLGPFTGAESVILSAVPLVMQQDPTADPSCQWSQRLVLTEISGWAQTVSRLLVGNVSLSDRIPAIFGTTQLAAYGSLEGVICWAGVSPGTTDTVSLQFAAGWSQDIAVSFAGPPANPPQLSVSPTSVTLSAVNANSAVAQATLNISAPDGQPWSIGISPQNLISGWVSLSQTTGSGSAQVTVQASGSGFETGAYHAELVIQGPNLSPAAITVPVMFVLGDSSVITIASLTNAASGQAGAAPGMLAVLKGSALAPSTAIGSGYSVGRLQSVLVTVNGVPAPVHSVAPAQIAFQIPYETGVGTAVVGVSYGNYAAGYMVQVTPSAPGIYADAKGNSAPTATVQAGNPLTLTMTGDGVTSPILPDGYTPATSSSMQFKPALPFTLTIGGAPAFLTSYGIVAGAQGVTTMNVAIPASTPIGVQPIVVTVGGVSSPPVNVTITAAAAK